MKKIKINESLCIGCGNCVSICPQTFKLNEKTSKAEVINQEGNSQEKIKEAIESCPATAISLETE